MLPINFESLELALFKIVKLLSFVFINSTRLFIAKMIFDQVIAYNDNILIKSSVKGLSPPYSRKMSSLHHMPVLSATVFLTASLLIRNDISLLTAEFSTQFVR